ncbi:MAG: effector binding domain-containing protein [Peptococcaceae bacterium]|nr:effector binding domain-containing protein [Peptococcaceae bacterium]
MLRIGEAARQFEISNRTLRYWEEKGILRSTRTESGYRYYDSENTARIRQIVLLRKLKMPLVDIEKLFVASDFGVAIDALSSHLANLMEDAAIYAAIIAAVKDLIIQIQVTQSLNQVFSFIKTQNEKPETQDAKTEIPDKKTIMQNAKTGSEHKSTPQIQLSERAIYMSKEQLYNVRIVQIPAMAVASYRVESSTPEDDCAKVFNRFVLENDLHKRDGYRYFGFNNPSPTKGSAVYGYEMWVSVHEDFVVPEPLTKKRFSGGLFASISTQINEIGERWRLLFDWCNDSEDYEVDSSVQWLEECTMGFEAFISSHISESAKQLDLLTPIKLKVTSASNC